MEPYLAEIRSFSFNFAPKGWAQCAGQLLPINTNQALFSLLGTAYGGDGRVNFALPDLRGRTPVHFGGTFHTVGVRLGQVSHTLTQQELPQHTHFVNADNSGPAATAGNQAGPAKRLSGSSPLDVYGAAQNLTAMHAGTVSDVGGSQAHNNVMPSSVIGFCIALIGIFPSMN